MEIEKTVKKEMLKDLIELEGELTNPKTNADNPYYHSKYAPLEEVLNIVRPALLKHNFALVQTLNQKEQIIYIKTSLIHTTGERIESELPIPLPTIMGENEQYQKTQIQVPYGLGDAQKIGAYITYMRRYSVLAMLNIVGEGEDDDAERVTEHEGKPPLAPQNKSKPPTKPPQKIDRYEEVHTGNALTDLQTELMLFTEGDKDKAKQVLNEITTFIDQSTGTTVKGVNSFKELKPDSTVVGIALGKFRDMKKKIKEAENGQRE